MKTKTDSKPTATSSELIVRSYEKHPFFVKKNREAIELLIQSGLPENYKQKFGQAK